MSMAYVDFVRCGDGKIGCEVRYRFAMTIPDDLLILGERTVFDILLAIAPNLKPQDPHTVPDFVWDVMRKCMKDNVAKEAETQ